ncbi:MAG TPA: MmcQ/YjbR family DNA-binding protein [Pyrinomonadaceae bacterium]|jgi:hypothetical protein
MQSGRQKPDSGEKQLERVRRISMSLPETVEKTSHGEPTFFVRKRVFAMCSNNHHNDGHIAVTLPAAIGVQEALIAANPEKFTDRLMLACAAGLELNLIGLTMKSSRFM